MSRTLFVRADGNNDIGIGHIVRSMTIAKVFREKGYECMFIVSKPFEHALFEKNGFHVIGIDCPYDCKTISEAIEITDLAKKYDAFAILVDSYYTHNEYLDEIRKTMSVICFSGAREKLSTDYLINDNIACEKFFFEEQYKNTDTKLLLGVEYTPIRSEFRGISYEVKTDAKSIFVTTGGGDRYNFMTDLVKKIKGSKVFDAYDFTFISGPYNEHYSELMDVSAGVSNISIMHNPSNIANLMASSDIAITAGGTTAIELSVIGVPSIGIAIAEDQVPGFEYMGKNGLIKYAGKVTEEHIWTRLFKYLFDLADDHKTRIIMSDSSRKLVDGMGAFRIFDAVSE